MLASGGTRGDFVSIDPTDGSLLLTQSTSIVRLRAPEGATFLPSPTNGLALTTAAKDAGFQLTEFVQGFNTVPSGSGLIGPLGIAYPEGPGGAVLVSEYTGNIWRFASNNDGQGTVGATVLANYGPGNAVNFAQFNGHIYMVQQNAGRVVEIDANGAIIDVIANVTGATGIAVDPTSGHLFVSTSGITNLIFDVDPVARTATPFVSAGAPDGLSFSADGSILYAAVINESALIGFDKRTGARVFRSAPINGLDGSAVGFGSMSGYAFVNTNFGQVWRVNLSNGADISLIASGGDRGDFIAIDPNDGSLLLTQSRTVARLRAPAGASFVQDFPVSVLVEDGHGGSDTQSFIVRAAQNGTVDGVVFNDANSNQVQDVDETGTPGRTIFLDVNNNGRFDSGELSAVSDRTGRYVIPNVAPGRYSIAQIGQAGWQSTKPDGTSVIDVTTGNTITVNFGNKRQDIVAERRPAITSTAPEQAIVGKTYSYVPIVSNPDGAQLRFDLPARPDGMAIDSILGTVVWIPTGAQTGKHNVILRVTDSRGYVSLQPITITVGVPARPPVFTSTPPLQAVASNAYVYQPRVTDPQGSSLTFALGTHPVGMAVDAAKGRISWVPNSSQLGTQHVVITATNALGETATQEFDVNVLNSAPNVAPKITTLAPVQARFGNVYSYALIAVDPDGDPLTYSLTTAPSGMAIDADGVITWSPAGSQLGANAVSVKVTDGRGGEAVQQFTVDVNAAAANHAPAITSTATLAATVNRAYRYTITATDIDNDTIAYSLVNGPAGMSVDSISGQVIWSPTADQLGSQRVTVQAMDVVGAATTQEFTVSVRSTNLGPTITSAPITTASTDRTYSYNLRAADPEGGPLTYSLPTASGDMQIDAQGKITWHPSAGEVGNVNVVVRVTDELGAAVEQRFTVVVSVAGPNQPPVITSTPATVVVVNRPYTYQVTARDPEGGAVRFALLEAPIGMQISESTGLITWTPDAIGIGRVTVLVGDFDGGESEQAFEVQVRAANVAPRITSTPVTAGFIGATYRYDVIATDANNDVLTYSLQQAPAGMAIDSSGRITWNAHDVVAGKQHIKLTVADDAGASAQQEFDLTVTADSVKPVVNLRVNGNPIAQDDVLIVVVSATDNVRVAALELKVDGVAVPLDANGRASLPMTKAGNVRLEASAKDTSGNVGTKSLDVLVIDQSVTEAPTVELVSPSDGAIVTTFADVVGTVQDARLVSWKLEYARVGSDIFTSFATGTTQVQNARLGTFDPTTLQNDSYVIRLTATNAGGFVSTAEQTLSVSGNLKLGNFTLSFTDLTIPVAGIPITVTRTYDTLQADQNGEVGFGWKIAFRDVDLRTNLTKTGDEAGGIYTPFRDGTRVYVTLPGGEREGFTFRPKAIGLFDPNQRERDVGPDFQSGNGFNAVYFVPNFVPDKGVTDKLTVNRFQLSKQGHEYFQFGGGLPYNPQDPAYGARFTLTTKDGIAYSIDAEAGKITRVSLPSGDSLAFSEDGISSSSGLGVKFSRDPQGRIVQVIDPDNKAVNYSYDSLGNLVSVTDRQNRTTQYEYATSRQHYLQKVTDPLGRAGVRAEYDASGKLIGILDGNGNRTQQINDIARSTKTIVDALGRSTSFQYDDRGNIVTEIDALGNQTRRTFDANDNVLSITNALQNTTNFSYDEFGNQLTVTDPLGNVIRTSFDSGNRPLTVTDALGNTTINKYDQRGNLISSVSASGREEKTAYDSNGQPTELTDAAGNVTRYAYDRRGWMNQSVDTLGNTRAYTHDSTGNTTSITTSRTSTTGQVSQVINMVMDVDGRVTSLQGPGGVTFRTEYDAAGQLVAQIDGSGRRTEYQYSDAGTLVAVVYPNAAGTAASRVTSEYDAANQLIASTDELGRTTKFVRDKLGRVIETIFPDATPATDVDNPRTKQEYDALGGLVAYIDERGNRTTYRYDAVGRLIEIRNALGQTQTNTFDANGVLAATTDALGRKISFVYDSDGFQIGTKNPDGTSTAKEFDLIGLQTSATDELGGKLLYQYDAAGRMTAVVDQAGQRTTFTYDEQGNLLTQTDASAHTTRYEYDSLGHRTATVMPLGQRSTATFDAADNIVGTTDANGKSIQYEYDSRNRMTAKRFADGSSITYTYTLTGQLATTRDDRGTTTYTYDERDRLISRAEPDGRTIRYGYDAAGNRTSMTTPAGTTTYEYDAINQLTKVTDPVAGLTSYAYDAAGNLTQTRYANGIVENRQYDSMNRLTFMEQTGPSGTVATYTYTRDAGGRIKSLDESSGRKVEYTYDAAYRLIVEKITDPTSTNITKVYSYDAVGNRISVNDNINGLTTYVYDANDRLSTETTGLEVTQYTYDAVGNLLRRFHTATDQSSMQWDVLGRMIAADVTNAQGTKHIVHRYNADGLRVSQSIDGQETRYLLDTLAGNAQVVEEYTPGGVVAVRYVYGENRIAQVKPAETSFYLQDGHGDVRMLASSTGVVTDRYTYDAFGQVLNRVGSTGNSYLYNAEFRDSILGFDYLRARYYSPGTGRFVSGDTFGGFAQSPASLNRYAYVHGDPVNSSDPSGNMEFSLVGTLKAIGTSAIVGSAAFWYTPAALFLHWADRWQYRDAIMKEARNDLNFIVGMLYPHDTDYFTKTAGHPLKKSEIKYSGLFAPYDGHGTPAYEHRRIDYLWATRKYSQLLREERKHIVGTYNDDQGYILRDVEYYYVGRTYSAFGYAPDESPHGNLRPRWFNITAGVAAVTVYEILKLFPYVNRYTQAEASRGVETPTLTGGGVYAILGSIHTGLDEGLGGVTRVGIPVLPRLK